MLRPGGFERHSLNGDMLSPFALIIKNPPVSLGKKGVILAATNVRTRVEPSTPLTNDYGTGSNDLTAETLYTKPLSR